MMSSNSINIQLPLTNTVIKNLHTGQRVRFFGTIYTARDAAHKRLIAQSEAGEKLPVNLSGQVIYYVGPTPPRPGGIIGSAGPTTSMRLDPYTPQMLALGVKGIIGKGGRSPAVQKAIAQAGAFYCIAVGGTGALLNRHITNVEVVGYEDLETEAIRKLELDGFPAIIVNDSYGGDLLTEGKLQYRTSERIIPEIKELR